MPNHNSHNHNHNSHNHNPNSHNHNQNFNRNMNINISNGSLMKSLGNVQNKNNTYYNKDINNSSIKNPDNYLTPNLLQNGNNKNLMNNLNKFRVISSSSSQGFK